MYLLFTLLFTGFCFTRTSQHWAHLHTHSAPGEPWLLPDPGLWQQRCSFDLGCLTDASSRMWAEVAWPSILRGVQLVYKQLRIGGPGTAAWISDSAAGDPGCVRALRPSLHKDWLGQRLCSRGRLGGVSGFREQSSGEATTWRMLLRAPSMQSLFHQKAPVVFKPSLSSLGCLLPGCLSCRPEQLVPHNQSSREHWIPILLSLLQGQIWNPHSAPSKANRTDKCQAKPPAHS